LTGGGSLRGTLLPPIFFIVSESGHLSCDADHELAWSFWDRRTLSEVAGPGLTGSDMNRKQRIIVYAAAFLIGEALIIWAVFEGFHAGIL
jgi:hypothetical protein